MPSGQNIAEFAVQEALKELRLGKKQAARSWALKALSNSPELEEPWLIMGELASPEGSLHYYQEALKINPGSQRAQNGLNEAQRRARKTGLVLNFNIPQRKTEVSLPAEPAMIAPVAEVVPVLVATPLPVEKKRRQKSLLRYKRRVGLWLIAPFLIGLVLYKMVPILTTLAMSFTNMDLLEPFKYKFVGLKNYIELLTDPRLGVAFLGTFKSALVLIPLQILAAVALASLLSSQKLHFKNTYRMLFFLPSIIASYPAYLMWAGFTNPQSGWLYPLLLNPLGLAKFVNFIGIGINSSREAVEHLMVDRPGVPDHDGRHAGYSRGCLRSRHGGRRQPFAELFRHHDPIDLTGHLFYTDPQPDHSLRRDHHV